MRTNRRFRVPAYLPFLAWFLLVGGVLAGIVALFGWAPTIGGDESAEMASGTSDGAVGTGSGPLGASEATLGTLLADRRNGGGPADWSELIGHPVLVSVDIGQAINDVAFWVGTPPDNLLVALDQDTRSGLEQQMGLPSDSPVNPPPSGVVTLRGVVEPIPHAEAMFSWELTALDVELLRERGVYVRAYEIVSDAPDARRAQP